MISSKLVCNIGVNDAYDNVIFSQHFTRWPDPFLPIHVPDVADST